MQARRRQTAALGKPGTICLVLTLGYVDMFISKFELLEHIVVIVPRYKIT